MFSGADDALMSCLVAAGLVVLAHGLDAVSSRRHRDGDGWGRSLALALCGVALASLVLGVSVASERGDLLVLLATGVAVCVSAIPLGRGHLVGRRTQPANPWDRAYRVHPARVAALLSSKPANAPLRRRRASAPGTPGPDRPGPRAEGAVREGVVLQHGETAPPAAAPDPRRAGSARTGSRTGSRPDSRVESRRTDAERDTRPPEVTEASDTLHDVGEVLGDVARLLGLDDDRRPRRAPNP